MANMIAFFNSSDLSDISESPPSLGKRRKL